MRAPVDAQSLGVTGGRVPRLPSQMWHHDNEALIRDSINYKVKYLGSVIVKKLHGSQSAEEACLKLRVHTTSYNKRCTPCVCLILLSLSMTPPL